MKRDWNAYRQSIFGRREEAARRALVEHTIARVYAYAPYIADDAQQQHERYARRAHRLERLLTAAAEHQDRTEGHSA